MYYDFLESLGPQTREVAAVVCGLVRKHVVAGDRIVLALDDPPTERFGPKVQGVGVLLACLVHPGRFGTLALPRRAAAAWHIPTELELAADLSTWARRRTADAGPRWRS